MDKARKVKQAQDRIEKALRDGADRIDMDSRWDEIRDDGKRQGEVDLDNMGIEHINSPTKR